MGGLFRFLKKFVGYFFILCAIVVITDGGPDALSGGAFLGFLGYLLVRRKKAGKTIKEDVVSRVSSSKESESGLFRFIKVLAGYALMLLGGLLAIVLLTSENFGGVAFFACIGLIGFLMVHQNKKTDSRSKASTSSVKTSLDLDSDLERRKERLKKQEELEERERRLKQESRLRERQEELEEHEMRLKRLREQEELEERERRLKNEKRLREQEEELEERERRLKNEKRLREQEEELEERERRLKREQQLKEQREQEEREALSKKQEEVKPKEKVVVKCPNCAANNTLYRGETCVCEACGSTISA